MKKIFFLSILITFTIVYAQQNTIVSLNKDNVWIYYVNNYERIDTIESYNSYSRVYKIVGDTIISNKEVKIIDITDFDSSKQNVERDYWYTNADIFQMHNPLRTYYDKNRINDSTWSVHGLGGYFGSGIIKKDSIYLYDNYYKNDIYNYNSSSSGGNSSQSFIVAEKFGLVKQQSNYYYWYFNQRMNGDNDMNLAGAIINGEYFGKLEPPEILNWKIEKNELHFDLFRADTQMVVALIYFWNNDNNVYSIIDSTEFLNNRVIKTFPQGTYNLRVSYRTIDGVESCFSNRIEFISSEIPENFQLKQNYPNPFNPVTKIGYLISNNCSVTINVYDLLGKKIKTLVNEEQTAGYYEVEFNGKGFSSGIYFYQIQSGEYIQTKKMVLLK